MALKSHIGTADIIAYGICDDLNLYSNGNGIIDSKAVESKRALVVNRSTGILSLKCNDLLDAEIYGRGNIEYLGDPAVNLYRTGLGNLIKR